MTKRGSSNKSFQRWWSLKFKITVTEGQRPEWHVDTLLAYEVIRPALNLHYDKLGLWRFHRRNKDDEAGRQFSFMFYGERRQARDIFNHIKTNALLKRLKSKRIIERVAYDDLRKRQNTAIKALSDSQWPEYIQDTWPYYIKGVSEMWLKLLEKLITNIQPKPTGGDLQELIDYYGAVNDVVNGLWQQHGGHSFLHHLHAVISWELVKVDPRMQFQIF
jgi:hypothetical protein